MTAEYFKTQLLALQTNLLNFALTLTSSRDDAYDLVQDTTLRALDNEDKYSDNVNFRGWVFTIMKNIFINNYRRSLRSGIVIDTSDDLYQLNVAREEDETHPDDMFAVNEIMSRIESYPPEYKIPFSLYLSGYRYAEIAKQMNLPVGTIKSRIFFARKRLRADFASYREDM